jgi:hypothetical protein
LNLLHRFYLAELYGTVPLGILAIVLFVWLTPDREAKESKRA